jgi:hypothetical protein
MRKFALAAALAYFTPNAKAETQDLLFLQELEAISMNESGGGKNLNHQEISVGKFKGTKAGGAYGLIPATVHEMIKTNRHLNRKYSHILFWSPDEITQEINRNHHLSQEIALVFWKQLRVNMNFGPSRAAYAWLYGPYAAVKVTEDLIQQDSYVTKFTEWLYWKNQNDKAKSKKS